MNTHPSEQEIITGCKTKSGTHQERLYKLYYGYVMAVSLAYVSDRNVAQEITDDTFMKVFNAIQTFNDQQSFKAWIRQIAVNTAIDHYRKNKRHMNHLDISATSKGLPEVGIIDHLTLEDIDQLIGELPDIWRMVFNLYEIEGYSHEEIARQLRIPEGSSRTYLMRARIRLRELVAKYFK